MRSELVGGALKQTPNRYLLTRLTAKAIRALHRPQTRIADTANDVLIRLRSSDAMAQRANRSTPHIAELRRAS
jgi:hypothetical protein